MNDLEQALKRAFEREFRTDVYRLQPLKQLRIYHIVTSDGAYVLKLFKRKEDAEWQAESVQQTLAKGATGLIPFLRGACGRVALTCPEWDGCFSVMPYLAGRAMNPANLAEIKDALHLLGHFHQHANGIVGKPQRDLTDSQWYAKWLKRYEQFKLSVLQLQRQELIDGLLQRVLRHTAEATTWAEWVLESFPRDSVLQLEQDAQRMRQVAHLDVAPHNFLRAGPAQYYLIDYDQFEYAPVIIDLIQYVHRVLGSQEWSFELVETLLQQYNNQRRITAYERRFFYLSLIYPHDFFREWLHVWKRKEWLEPEQVSRFFYQLNETWEMRRSFVRSCLAVVKYSQ